VKLLYKPFGLVIGALAGLTAGRLFKQAWRLAAHEDDTPDAKDRERTWREVVFAAALEGAIFGAVKAAVDRSGAVAFAEITGVWPGNTKPTRDKTDT
jgi:predicted metal-dependent enzyme (double-stranded beta helix superfamily)